jgi:hypothetical protein
MAWTKAKTAIIAAAAVIFSVVSYTAVEKVIHFRTAEHGKQILRKVVAANRLWLLAPPDTVTDYSYIFHHKDYFYVFQHKGRDGSRQKSFHVTNPSKALPQERQGITYSSLLQRLARNPEQVQVQSVKEANGKIRLALEILRDPGARTTMVIAGQRHLISPLGVECGNGVERGSWCGYFSAGGTNAELVIDAKKMVPLNSVVKVSSGTVEESFSDYTETSSGSYVPLSVTVKDTRMWPPELGDGLFAWKFKLHDGLWLFDESQYHGERIAWTDQVVVN